MKKLLFLSLFMLLNVLSVRAYDFKVANIYYNIIEGSTAKVEVSGKDSYPRSITIPATVEYDGVTYVVSAIGDSAFDGCSELYSVIISDGITHIGNRAFSFCMYLSSVTIPESVISIGNGAFSYSYSITSLTIPDGVTFIGAGAFSFCSGLTKMTIPESVTTLGDGLFWGCRGLMSVVMHESITSIGESAFCGCSSLTSINIPSKVTTISNRTFQNCSGLESINIGESITSIGDDAFQNCSGLKSVIIGENVDSIGTYAFYNCSGLTLIEWNAINCEGFATNSYSNPFSGCDNINVITFGNEVEYIPAYLCYGCSGLASVTIPESVTSIGYSAFYGCTGLTSVTSLAENPPICGSDVFLYSYDAMLYVPSGCKAAYQEASIWRNFYKIKVIGLFVVDVFANSAVMGRVIGGGEYENGESVTLEALPNSGYHFVKWDDGSTDNPRTLMVTCDTAFTAEFAVNTYTVTAQVNNETMGCVSGGGEYENGEMVTLEALPNSGYHFVKWDDENTGNPRILKVTEDITLTAIFAENENIVFTVTVLANDAVMGTVLGGGQYARDDQVTLVAIPNQGYHFVRWDDGNTANPRILTVTEDITLTAIFAKTGSNPNDPNNPNDPSDPNNPGGTTANEEALAAAPFAYVQGRTAYLSDGLGEVEAFTMTGQRVYRGFDRSIALPQPGVYILRVVADGRRCKVIVR